MPLLENNIDELLNQARKAYLNHKRGVSIQNDTLYLSSLFDWYQNDFVKDEESLLQYLIQHSSKIASLKSNLSNFKIKYQYDWALNCLC